MITVTMKMELPKLVMLSCKLYTKYGTEIHNRIRNEHSKPMDKKNEVCKKCYYPRKTETSEKATVDGREVTSKS